GRAAYFGGTEPRRRRLRLAAAVAIAPVAALAVGPAAWAGTELDVASGSTDLTSATSYVQNAAPTSTSDVTFTNTAYSPAAFTIGTALTIGTLNDLSPTALSISGTGAVTLSGGTNSISPAAADLIYVAAAGNLTVSNTPLVLTTAAANGNFDIEGTASLGGVISGTGFGFTKTGAGTLTLGGTNTFTGGVTISAGAVRYAADANLGGAGTVTLNGGTLQATAGVTTTTRVINVGTGGGTFTTGGGQYFANAANLLTGSGALTVTSTGGNNANLRLGAANSYSGQLTIQGGGNVELGAANAVAAAATIVVNAGGELDAQGNAAIAFANAITVNGGVLSFENGNGGSFSGPVTAGAGGLNVALRDWYSPFNVRNGTISGAIGGGAVSVSSGTLAGGVLVLSGANTFTGPITVTRSALQAADGTGLPAGANLVLDGGVLQPNNAAATFTRPLGTGAGAFQTTANGGGFAAVGGVYTVNVGGAAGTLTFGATPGTDIVGPLLFGSATANNQVLFQNGLDLTGGARTITVSSGAGGDSANVAGAIVNTGAAGATLTKGGAGRLVLSGANTYDGGTTVATGVLQFAKPAAMSATGTVTVAAGATLAVNAGGAGEFTAATTGAGTIGGLAAGTGGQGAPVAFAGGSLLGIDPTNAAGASLTYAGAIANQGAGALGVNKLGSAASVLTPTGASTYTGPTVVSAGVLAVPSVANAGAASPIGAASAASSNLVLAAGTFRYTGGAGGTDRLFSLGTGTSTIDVAGAGPLAFTNAGAVGFNGQSGARTLNLASSSAAANAAAVTTANSNVIASVIGDNGGATSVVLNSGVNTLLNNNRWALTGANTFTGGVTVTSGTLTATNSASLGAGTKTVTLTNGTSGNPVLRLDGSGGAVVLPATFTYTTSNNSSTTTGAFVSDAGTNVIAGTINPTSGGGDTPVVVNGGYLVVSANVTTAATGLGTRSLRLRGAGNGSLTGVLSNGSSTIGLVQEGTGTWTVTGANTYTGATAVNLGTLALNGSGAVLGATAVTVGSGAAVGATAGNATLLVRGNQTVGTAAGGSITVNGGDGTATGQGTLSLADGAINTLTLPNLTTAANSLILGSATNPAVLTLEVGVAGASDRIVVGTSTNKLAVNAGGTVGGTAGVGAVINVVPTGALGAGTYTLLSYPGGQTSAAANGGFAFPNGQQTMTIGPATLTLTNSATAETLTVTTTAGAVPATAYFQGSLDATWNAFDASPTPNSNWTTDAAGAANANQIPGTTTDVHLYASNATAANLSTTLGQNFTVKSLTVDGGSLNQPVSVASGGAGANTLTLAPAAGGVGLLVAAGAGATTVTAPVALGSAQTWTNNSSATLTVSGPSLAIGTNNLALGGTGNTVIAAPITGGGTITKTQGGGTSTTGGTVTISGNNAAFTGNVTVASGPLVITNGNALGVSPKTITVVPVTNPGSTPSLQLDGSGGNIVLPASLSFTTSYDALNGGVPIAGAGAVVNVAGNNTILGNFGLTSGGGGTTFLASAGSLTIAGNLNPTTTSRALYLRGNGTGTISGVVANGSTAALPVTRDAGTGTWVLSGANTYSGATSVTAGTLLANAPIVGTASSATGTGAVTASGAGTIGGTGGILGTLTVNPGGTVAPGSGGIGTLSVAGAVTFGATGT
ncbi:MAG TPA: autotransporter-associated beta strand repeat-containing protein, partial [Humisphaera sp.]